MLHGDCTLCIQYTKNFVFNFSNGHNQKVHMHMVDLMSSIICEGDTVSQELLDTVLVNLVPAHKVRLNSGLILIFFFNCYLLDVCVQIFAFLYENSCSKCIPITWIFFSKQIIFNSNNSVVSLLGFTCHKPKYQWSW